MADGSILGLEMGAVVIGDGVHADLVMAQFAPFLREAVCILNGLASAAGLENCRFISSGRRNLAHILLDFAVVREGALGPQPGLVLLEQRVSGLAVIRLVVAHRNHGFVLLQVFLRGLS